MLAVTASPSAAAPGPTGTLAFGTGQFVFAVGAGGGGGHALGTGDYPVFSHDGRRLALTSNGVWVANADGTHRQHIVPRFAEYLTYASPTWSPDGRTLAYVRVDNGHETSELWLVDSNGRRLHGLSIVHAATDPAWSPDGRWIAYAGDGGLSEVLADGSGKRVLLHRQVVSPAWSPDGTTIAFEQEADGGTVAIELLDVRLKRLRVLERHAGPAGPIAFSPDGAWLAFATARADAGGAIVQLRTVRVHGGGERVVARSFVQRLDGLSWRR